MLRRAVTLPVEWLLLGGLSGFVGLRIYAIGFRAYSRSPKPAAFGKLPMSHTVQDRRLAPAQRKPEAGSPLSVSRA